MWGDSGGLEEGGRGKGKRGRGRGRGSERGERTRTRIGRMEDEMWEGREEREMGKEGGRRYLGEMTPFPFTTRCHGTLPAW